MAKIQKTVITALGEQMLFSSALTYTDATLCSQDISNLTIDQLRSLTDLTGKVLSSPISAHKRQGNTKADQVDVQVTFTNQDQKADINYSSIGWFARDHQGQETLIAVTPFIGTDTIAAAPPDGTATSSKNITLSMAAGTATEINVLIDPAGSVTPSTFNAEVDKINEALALKADNAELADYAKKADVNSALDAKADKTDVASDVKSLNDAINAKASQADLDKTNAVVATKANATALADYARTVDVDADLDTKANKTDLESLAKTADVNSALDTKADKTTVDDDVKTLQASIDTKADKTALDDYAKSADVASDVKTLTDSIATKADAKTVNDAISKIDFTPYAKSADVANELQNYTTTVDLNKLLAGKEDAGTSYSKAELDKKLLALSTDTDGKVNADQVSSMIANKVDKSDLASDLKSINDSIATKANTTDVNTALAKKDDTTDVDAKIKTVIDLANTKADKTDVTAQFATKADKTTVEQELTTKANASDVYTKKQVDDALSSRDTAIATKADKATVDEEIGKIDFSPYVKIVDVYSKTDANKLLDAKADKTALNSYDTITDVDSKIKTVTDLANTKANASDLSALDSRAVKSIGIYPNDLNFTNGQFTNWSIEMKANPDDNGYALIDLSDDVDARAAANQLNAMLTGLNHLQGKQTKDSADANALSETGVYYCSSPAKNFPVSQWGTLVTSNGNGERASQLYFPDDNSAVWFRTLKRDWRGWVRLANIGDVNNAESSLTSLINTKANAAQTTANAVSNKVNVTVPLFRRITAANTWNDILGASNSNAPVLVSIRDEGGANTLGNFSAAVAFGGGDTKGVLNVAYSDHTARIIGGNGSSPVWHEDIAWKSDISSLTQALTKLQAAFDAQQTKIAALQATVNNQANQLTYFKQHYIEGKAFDADQIKQAMAWTGDDGQKLAIIRDKENEGGK